MFEIEERTTDRTIRTTKNVLLSPLVVQTVYPGRVTSSSIIYSTVSYVPYDTYVLYVVRYIKKKKSQRKKEVLCLNFLTATSVGVSKKASGGVRRPRERGGARAARAAEQGRAKDRKQREHLQLLVHCGQYCTVPYPYYRKGKYVSG